MVKKLRKLKRIKSVTKTSSDDTQESFGLYGSAAEALRRMMQVHVPCATVFRGRLEVVPIDQLRGHDKVVFFKAGTGHSPVPVTQEARWLQAFATKNAFKLVPEYRKTMNDMTYDELVEHIKKANTQYEKTFKKRLTNKGT